MGIGAPTSEIGFTDDELQLLLQNLDQMTPAEMAEIDRMVDELKVRDTQKQRQDDLIAFCVHMMPAYLVGRHHRRLANLLMDIEAGRKDRICVSVPPRHGKSQMASIFYAAWYLGKNPGHKVMLVSHTTDLAVDFGRKVRNIIASPEFQEVFPDIFLAADSKSAGRWSTNFGGEFFACGVGSALAGRGAHLLLIDDPHSEQDILNGNFSVFAKAYEWFAFGARTRLMPEGKVAIIHTRWHLDDLIGRVTRDMAKNPRADQYEVFEFPAILETDIVTPAGAIETQETALWPEFFDLEALHRTKASMPLYQWNAQFQQNPTSEEAAIVKRDWWRVWTGAQPPQCEYLISSLDSAAEKHNKADYTSLTTWGVFFNDETSQHELILLNAIKDRFEFPELKQMCMDHVKEWEPDSFIVEKKSSGTAVYQELRRMGIAVSEYTPHRGSGDKYARLNAVSDMIASGLVWVPETRWADDLVDEIASFPYGSNDDQVDSSVMALTRFRQGGFIRLATDYKDEPLGYQDTQGYY
tara:strand:- start:797 stop:2368 length:1572 start_codon:yes stop_codon:yes gene_type:complete